MVKVLEAHVVTAFTVWLRFSDGTEGSTDLARELQGPVFEPLRDPSYFALLRVDPELDTIAWPNGADFAPEFLCERVKLAAA
ncbi:MAG TPA: DUF2442 domain-containing protein [Bryobacteraceae bacterium]|nr:DUF2442 domain-containing protein [Bryobacteraceae bacterium]